MEIPYVDLPAQHEPLKEEILEAVERVLDHGWFVLGEEVDRIEARLADYLDVPHVVGVGSGTDALMLAMRLRGIGPGDEVVTVSHTYTSTVSSIAALGANPVFVDVAPDTMTMDPDRLEAAITDRTRAVVPVHLNGFPCPLDAIRSICDRHDLALIEDCAQALGARYDGEPVGSADLGAFSLHPLKILSACGDAGFVTLQRDDEADRLRRLRNNGHAGRDRVTEIGRNSRLDTIQAAILLVKFEHLEEWIQARRRHARRYREALPDCLRMPPAGAGGDRAVYSMFVVRHPLRDALHRRLRDRGIDVKIHYPRGVHEQPPFASRTPGELPVTEEIVSQILSLPVTPELSDDQHRRVVAAIEQELREIHP